jgi:hypothetical protein
MPQQSLHRTDLSYKTDTLWTQAAVTTYSCSRTWELMRLKLPQADNVIPCFKEDTQVYLLIKGTLHSFTSLEVKPRQFLKASIVTRVTTAEALSTTSRVVASSA